MPAPFKPDVVCFADAAAKRTALALSVVKLFKEGYVPVASTVLADLDAQECDFTDYTPQTITAWGAPTKSIVGGAEITAPTVQFTCTGAQAVPNAVGGYWIETAGGLLVLVRMFQTAVPMAQLGDAVKINPTYQFPPGS